jgi:branched-chain amino acid transport system permease protein
MNTSARFWTWFWLAVIGLPIVVFVVWANITNPRQFVSTLLNGVTLAALYFLVASGFTLVFGLMRNVNLAHGSLYRRLYRLVVGRLFHAAGRDGRVPRGPVSFVQGQELCQTMVMIGISIILADLAVGLARSIPSTRRGRSSSRCRCSWWASIRLTASSCWASPS